MQLPPVRSDKASCERQNVAKLRHGRILPVNAADHFVSFSSAVLISFTNLRQSLSDAPKLRAYCIEPVEHPCCRIIAFRGDNHPSQSKQKLLGQGPSIDAGQRVEIRLKRQSEAIDIIEREAEVAHIRPVDRAHNVGVEEIITICHEHRRNSETGSQYAQPMIMIENDGPSIDRHFPLIQLNMVFRDVPRSATDAGIL